MANAKGLDLLHKQLEFSGCKIALLCDNRLLTILRDDISTIPWPNMWELPGGGREARKRLLNAYKEKFSKSLV